MNQSDMPTEHEPPELEDLLEAIAHEYLEALRAGRGIDAEEVVERHPQIPSAALRSRLRVVELLHEAAASPSRGTGPMPAGPLPAGWAAAFRCPHCNHPLSIGAPAASPTTCANCGSSFNVIEDAGPDWDEPALPEAIGRFRVDEVLGQGAFGVVYRARDPDLGRDVTLKVPRAGAFSSAEDLSRFLREARSVAALSHPGIVQVFEITEHHSLPCIVREYIDGRTLQAAAATDRFTFREAAELVASVADALDYAHSRGVIHRDVKPENVMLDGSRRPHVTDFGLARRDEGEVTVTLDGQILGTPAYMSPEQAMGRQDVVDARTDVYSLGVVLYELLTGERPFSGQRSMVIHQVIHDDPRAPRRLNEHIPRDLEVICLKAMEKEPPRRYESAAGMAADLRRHLRGEPIRARPVGTVERIWRWCRRNPGHAATAAASAAVILGGLIGFIFWQQAHQVELRTEIVQKDDALQREEGSRLTTLSSLLLSENPGRALLAAIEGAKRSPGLLSDDALRGALAALREERTLIRQDGGVEDLVFTPDGTRVVSVSLDVVVWDVKTGEMLVRILEDGFLINSVDVSPDGSKLVTTSWDGKARIWDVASGQLAATLPCSGVVENAEFSADGGLVITCSTDNMARLWDARTGEKLHDLRHGSPVTGASFHPDGKSVATACNDRIARIWSTSGELLKQLEGHEGWIVDCAHSPDGRRLVTASIDGTARIWDAVSGEPILVFRGHERSVARAVFSPDGSRVLTASADHTARIFDAATGRELQVLRGHGDELTAAWFSPDGKRALTASEDSTARVWDAERGLQLAVLSGHEGPVRAARFSPDGTRVASGSFDATVRIWDASTERDLLAATRRPDWGRQAAFSPDRNRVVTVTRGAIAEIFDVETAERLAALEGHTGRIQAVSFDAGGKRVATAACDHTARIWEASTGNLLMTLSGHANWVNFASFSPDGALVATAARDFKAKLWDATTGKALKTLQHKDWVNAAFFSPDGKRVATLANDQTAGIWNTETGERLHTLKHSTVILFRGAFSHDGRWLVVSAADNRVHLWDTITGEHHAVLEGHTGLFTAAVFDRACSKLATIFRDGTARVWTAPGGQLLGTIRAPTADFLSGRFSEQGDALHTVAIDGTEREWPLNPLPVATACKPRELTPDELDRLRVGAEAERKTLREEHERTSAHRRLELAERLWKGDPRNDSVRNQYIRVFSTEALRLEKAEATRALERAVERAQVSDPKTLILLALYMSRDGRQSEAVRLCERAAAVPPLDPRFIGMLGAFRKRALPDLCTYGSIDAALRSLDETVIAGERAKWRLFRGKSDPGEAWPSLDFDDSSWEVAESGFGFPKERAITLLSDMKGAYTSIYVRRRFTVDDPAAWRHVVLSLTADDGCVAYLNGEELGRARVDMTMSRFPFDATASMTPRDPVIPFEITIPDGRFRRGDNVVAVQLLSIAKSKDAFLTPILSAVKPPDAARDRALFRSFKAAAKGEDAEQRIEYFEGRLFMRRESFPAAVKAFEGLASRDGSDLVRCRVIECLRLAGDAREADRRIAELAAVEAPPGSETDAKSEPVDPLALEHSAQYVLLAGERSLHDCLRAYRWARTAARFAPINLPVLRTLALAEYRLGLLDAALATLDKIDTLVRISLKPRGAPVILLRALVLEARGDRDGARRELAAAREIIAKSEHDSFAAPELLLEAVEKIAKERPPPTLQPR